MLRDIKKKNGDIMSMKVRMRKTVILLFGVILVLAISIFAILLLASRTEKSILSDGTYAPQYIISHIKFDVENQEFTFLHTPQSSYFPHGHFECRDGKVIAIDTDIEGTYVFEIVDDKTIVFLKSESTETPLREGLEFTLMEETLVAFAQ